MKAGPSLGICSCVGHHEIWGTKLPQVSWCPRQLRAAYVAAPALATSPIPWPAFPWAAPTARGRAIPRGVWGPGQLPPPHFLPFPPAQPLARPHSTSSPSDPALTSSSRAAPLPVAAGEWGIPSLKRQGRGKGSGAGCSWPPIISLGLWGPQKCPPLLLPPRPRGGGLGPHTTPCPGRGGCVGHPNG